MKKRQQKFIIQKLDNIQRDLLDFATKENEAQIVQALKMIFIAKKILNQKELITFGKKAGE